MAVLITGGAGFIGSHTCVELLQNGEEVIVMDNFYNSDPKALDGIREITGRDFKFYEADMLYMPAIDRIFDENDIELVIHLAGYKSIPESVKKPLLYYSNNLRATFNILETMKKYGCTKFIFGSSAAAYGIPEKLSVSEDSPLSPINPYGSTKLIIEKLCHEMYTADNSWTMILLRIFNTVGAHKSGLIGENPVVTSDSLMSGIIDKALGKRDVLEVYGNDYPTGDGSCVRDYIHVTDLAKGLAAAFTKARELNNGCVTYNLGSGRCCSVFEILDTFRSVNDIDLEYTIGSRRSGDAPEYYSDSSLAEKELQWKAELGIEDICRDAWNYAKNK